jgi:hypothetical protein
MKFKYQKHKPILKAGAVCVFFILVLLLISPWLTRDAEPRLCEPSEMFYTCAELDTGGVGFHCELKRPAGCFQSESVWTDIYCRNLTSCESKMGGVPLVENQTVSS